MIDPAHATPAAAGGKLNQNRISDGIGLLFKKSRLLSFAVITRNDRHAGFLHQGLGVIFQPHGADGRWREGRQMPIPLAPTGLGKIGAFGQKSVAGMNAFSVRLFRRLDDPLNGKIALARFGAADEVTFVAQSPMQSVRVGGRIDRDRSHTETFRGATDPASDLAAIGNEN